MSDDEVRVLLDEAWEQPSHDFALYEGEWWGCSEPERPTDNGQRFDSHCRACTMKLVLDHTVGASEDFVVVIENASGEDRYLSVEQVVRVMKEQAAG